MSSLTRRAFIGVCTQIAVILPIVGVVSDRVAESEEFVIWNGWVLKSSDLRNQSVIFDIDKAAGLPSAERYRVCIAGGGVAGIVLAKSLSEQGLRVLLLEAGGLEYWDRSQLFYRGENIGREYFDLDTARLRFLGGTSNHWNGWCRPLEPYDFSKRDYISDSGWPIDRTELDPYLAAAREILEIDAFPKDRNLAGADGDLKEIFFRWSPPVRFKDKFQNFLELSDAVNVCLNANLVDIPIDSESGRVIGFRFRSYSSDRPVHEVVADQYVLALGGIENARALLHLAAKTPSGLLSEHNLVGRFFSSTRTTSSPTTLPPISRRSGKTCGSSQQPRL
jgi:hypothetical protein